MATALKTQGTQLYKVQTATTSITVGNIQNISLPAPKADTKEITDMSSTGKEYVALLPDFGEVSCDINFDPELISTSLAGRGHQALVADADAGTTRNWIIGLSDGNAAPTAPVASVFPTPPTTRTWIQFNGFITEFSMKAGTNDVIGGSLTVKCTGSPTRYYKP